MCTSYIVRRINLSYTEGISPAGDTNRIRTQEEFQTQKYYLFDWKDFIYAFPIITVYLLDLFIFKDKPNWAFQI